MIERRFTQCDVFGEAPLMGNGLAVVTAPTTTWPSQ
jgi:predicted PhzF superfamily epimerase YddE/YHI9